MRLKVCKQKNGSFKVSVGAGEALVLEQLPERLRELMEDSTYKKRIEERLFPRAYRKNAALENEYQQLLGDDLKRRKEESIAAFERTLRRFTLRGNRAELTIAPEEFELWMGFVNDMRLVLAVALDITDESWGGEFDPLGEGAEDLALLHYLSWLEEELIRATGFPGLDVPAAEDRS